MGNSNEVSNAVVSAVTTSADPGIPVCGSYRPGHLVHYIQVNLASRTEGTSVWIGDIAEDSIQVEVDGDPATWRLHDPDRLRGAVERAGVPMARLYGHGLLVVGSAVFYPARELHDWTPCDPSRGRQFSVTNGIPV